MSTEAILIREATGEDLPFLRAMIWEAVLASPGLLARHGLERLQQFEDGYWSGWEKHPDPAFVAVDTGGRKVGAITLKADDAERPVRGWRIAIGVETEVRGRGVGYRLLERAIAFAREQGAAYVNLFVDPANARAIALYQRVGFRETERPDDLMEMRISLL
jgi:ribosomal protein S18 acetylase RimI-like enzyme